MTNEVFYPETIDPTPLPTITGALELSTATNQPSTGKDVYLPQQTLPQRFPERIIAPGVISDTINTLSKQILGNFTFGQVGALSIGLYQNGISGEIKLSPNGIVALNVNGETTFALDGATGDATFLGTISAGSLIAGDGSVLIDGDPTGGRIVIFTSGIPSIVIGNV
jgi:hypothetical protein